MAYRSLATTFVLFASFLSSGESFAATSSSSSSSRSSSTTSSSAPSATRSSSTTSSPRTTTSNFNAGSSGPRGGTYGAKTTSGYGSGAKPAGYYGSSTSSASAAKLSSKSGVYGSNFRGGYGTASTFQGTVRTARDLTVHRASSATRVYDPRVSKYSFSRVSSPGDEWLEPYYNPLNPLYYLYNAPDEMIQQDAIGLTRAQAMSESDKTQIAGQLKTLGDSFGYLIKTSCDELQSSVRAICYQNGINFVQKNVKPAEYIEQLKYYATLAFDTCERTPSDDDNAITNTISCYKKFATVSEAPTLQGAGKYCDDTSIVSGLLNPATQSICFRKAYAAVAAGYDYRVSDLRSLKTQIDSVNPSAGRVIINGCWQLPPFASYDCALRASTWAAENKIPSDTANQEKFYAQLLSEMCISNGELDSDTGTSELNCYGAGAKATGLPKLIAVGPYCKQNVDSSTTQIECEKQGVDALIQGFGFSVLDLSSVKPRLQKLNPTVSATIEIGCGKLFPAERLGCATGAISFAEQNLPPTDLANQEKYYSGLIGGLCGGSDLGDTNSELHYECVSNASQKSGLAKLKAVIGYCDTKADSYTDRLACALKADAAINLGHLSNVLEAAGAFPFVAQTPKYIQDALQNACGKMGAGAQYDCLKNGAESGVTTLSSVDHEKSFSSLAVAACNASGADSTGDQQYQCLSAIAQYSQQPKLVGMIKYCEQSPYGMNTCALAAFESIAAGKSYAH